MILPLWPGRLAKEDKQHPANEAWIAEQVAGGLRNLDNIAVFSMFAFLIVSLFVLQYLWFYPPAVHLCVALSR